MENVPATRNIPLTAAQIKGQVQLIQEVMSAVMKEGHHYGKIPGTPKPTLYKPGAEKLMSTFHIGVDPREEIVDLSTQDEIRYRVAVKGFDQANGDLLGVGIGECSSSEEKYKWRKPVCDAEFDEAPTDRKREVWKMGSQGPYKQRQVRMNPIDVANTILKMAKKRALIDMTLTVTAASDIFDQDLEDLPEGMDLQNGKKPPIQEPKKKDPEKPALPSVTVAVEKVEIKKGTKKDGTPWTLYVVHSAKDDFNTFSKTFGELAQKACDEKVNAIITYKETEKGKVLESIALEEPPADENAQ